MRATSAHRGQHWLVSQNVGMCLRASIARTVEPANGERLHCTMVSSIPWYSPNAQSCRRNCIDFRRRLRTVNPLLPPVWRRRRGIERDSPSHPRQRTAGAMTAKRRRVRLRFLRLRICRRQRRRGADRPDPRDRQRPSSRRGHSDNSRRRGDSVASRSAEPPLSCGHGWPRGPVRPTPFRTKRGFSDLSRDLRATRRAGFTPVPCIGRRQSIGDTIVQWKASSLPGIHCVSAYAERSSGCLL